MKILNNKVFPLLNIVLVSSFGFNSGYSSYNQTPSSQAPEQFNHVDATNVRNQNINDICFDFFENLTDNDLESLNNQKDIQTCITCLRKILKYLNGNLSREKKTAKYLHYFCNDLYRQYKTNAKNGINIQKYTYQAIRIIQQYKNPTITQNYYQQNTKKNYKQYDDISPEYQNKTLLELLYCINVYLQQSTKDYQCQLLKNINKSAKQNIIILKNLPYADELLNNDQNRQAIIDNKLTQPDVCIRNEQILHKLGLLHYNISIQIAQEIQTIINRNQQLQYVKDNKMHFTFFNNGYNLSNPTYYQIIKCIELLSNIIEIQANTKFKSIAEYIDRWNFCKALYLTPFTTQTHFNFLPLQTLFQQNNPSKKCKDIMIAANQYLKDNAPNDDIKQAATNNLSILNSLPEEKLSDKEVEAILNNIPQYKQLSKIRKNQIRNHVYTIYEDKRTAIIMNLFWPTTSTTLTDETNIDNNIYNKLPKIPNEDYEYNNNIQPNTNKEIELQYNQQTLIDQNNVLNNNIQLYPNSNNDTQNLQTQNTYSLPHMLSYNHIFQNNSQNLNDSNNNSNANQSDNINIQTFQITSRNNQWYQLIPLSMILPTNNQFITESCEINGTTYALIPINQ